MDRTTISNGIVVTLDEDDTVLVGGTVVLEDDKIAYVGPPDKAPQPAGKVIDASGKAVMPGLVDLHYHTAIAKGFSDHLPLWEYLDACWYPFIRTLDADAYVTFTLKPDGTVDEVRMVAVSPLTDFSFDFQDLLFRPVAINAAPK